MPKFVFSKVFFGDEVHNDIEKAQLETERDCEAGSVLNNEMPAGKGGRGDKGKFDPTMKPHEDLKRQMSESLLQKRKSISEEQL